MSRDHRQIEVNIGLCKLLFKQSEAGILVGGMTIVILPAARLCMDNSLHLVVHPLALHRSSQQVCCNFWREREREREKERERERVSVSTIDKEKIPTGL